MKRIFSMLVVTVLLLALALPALAVPPPTTHGTFVCYTYDPITGEYTEVNRVPRGQVAVYESQGYECYRTYGQ